MADVLTPAFKPRPVRPAPPRGPIPKVTTTNPHRLLRQHIAACATGGVAVVLTGLSLAHLADGIGIVTGAGFWQRGAMAAGIDLGFLACEAALLCSATEAVRRNVGRWAHPTVAASLGLSGLLNALAFAHEATEWRLYAAAGLGLAVPALIYALVRVTFVLATQGTRAEA